jgi:Na+-driven multidrug efflux pump
LFGNVVFNIYNASASVTDYGLIGIRYYAIGLLFMGISNAIAVFYQAIGKGFEALILSVARQGFFFIPLILILPGILGIDGVLASQAIADLLTVLLSVVVIVPFLLKNKIDTLMVH